MPTEAHFICVMATKHAPQRIREKTAHFASKAQGTGTGAGAGAGTGAGAAFASVVATNPSASPTDATTGATATAIRCGSTASKNWSDAPHGRCSTRRRWLSIPREMEIVAQRNEPSHFSSATKRSVKLLARKPRRCVCLYTCSNSKHRQPPPLGSSYVSVASWSFFVDVFVVIVVPVFVVWCVDGEC